MIFTERQVVKILVSSFFSCYYVLFEIRTVTVIGQKIREVVFLLSQGISPGSRGVNEEQFDNRIHEETNNHGPVAIV